MRESKERVELDVCCSVLQHSYRETVTDSCLVGIEAAAVKDGDM